MATKVLDIIISALQNLGAIAIEEVPSAAESAGALATLNNMIDMWNTESLLVYNITENVFPFVPGQASYTLGSGGQFNIPRPVKIDLAYSRDSQGNDYKMGVTDSPDIYADIISKYTQSTFPTFLYDNGDFPLKTITFWPVPSDGSYSAVLWVWGPISSFANIADSVILPPGYNLALEYNLAVLLAPKYGKPVSEDLKALALSSKAQLKRINYSIKEMNYDPAMTGTGIVFNYYTGYPGVN